MFEEGGRFDHELFRVTQILFGATHVMLQTIRTILQIIMMACTLSCFSYILRKKRFVKTSTLRKNVKEILLLYF